MTVLQFFERPVVIIFSWTILIVGMMGAAKLIGAKMPTEGVLAGPGDMFRNV